jgi:NAD(P)-dependent dehydrogenase (short-subunit alcohol dehydrogenase family)
MRILAGQVVLLTGASGGLGTYMAQAFAERKVKLALVAHPGIDLEGLRKSIADAGAQVIALTCDLRDPAQRRPMLAAARSRLGLINIIANNAGGEVQLGVPRPERGTDWRAAKREPGSANDPQPVGVARNA